MMDQIFENTETAFALKTDSELERAYFLFKLIANEPLVKIGSAVTNFAIKAHLPIEGLIRATVFDHFCGGVNEEDCLGLIARMHYKGVYTILDYSVEGKEEEAQFDYALEKTLHMLNYVKENEAVPFAVFKPTGFGRFALYEKVSSGTVLTMEEELEWKRIVQRYEIVCEKAYQMNVALLIDAEESWMQKAADDLAEAMMRKYNTKNAIIYNTLQMYRWDRASYLKGLQERALENSFKIGIKIVRGAYMEKENDRAEDKGYPSPICPSKKSTDENFDALISYVMHHLDGISTFVGTHNEQSTYKLMELMEKHGITKNDKRIWFGQLYGMSDHISYNLAAQGYNVSKYLPFGPVRDVMPYLIRRAEENTSVAGQTSRELDLLKKERKRRKI